MTQLNFKGLQLDTTKMRQFKEFLEYNLKKKSALEFDEFRRNCGISKIQWEQFKEINLENKTKLNFK